MTKDTEQINTVHVCSICNNICNKVLKTRKKAYRIYNSNISLSGISSETSGSSTSFSHSSEDPGVEVDGCEAGVIGVVEFSLKKLKIDFVLFVSFSHCRSPDNIKVLPLCFTQIF